MRFWLNIPIGKGDNTYFFYIGGREYKARRLKDLYKAFPGQSAELKAYVKENQYTLEKAQQAFKVISYLKTLVNPSPSTYTVHQGRPFPGRPFFC